MNDNKNYFYDFFINKRELESQNIELQEMQNELLRVIDSYADLFDFAPVGYLILDKNGTIKKINLTGCQILGKERHAVEGFPLASFFKKEDRKAILQHFARLKTSNKRLEVEARKETKYTLKYYRIISDSYHNYLMNCPEIRTALIEITENRRLQEELELSERRFKYLAQNAPVNIWLAGPNKMCYYFNERFMKFTGRNFKDLFGLRWLQFIHPEDQKRCISAYEKAFEDRKEYSLEFRMLRHDGKYRWLSEKAAPFFYGNSFSGFIGICIDINKEKERRHDLDISIQTKTIHIKEMHHRIKNSLQMISSLIHLQLYSLDEKSQGVFNEVQSRINAIAALHDHLQSNNSADNVNIKSFLESLIKKISKNFSDNIDIMYSIEEIELDQKLSVDIGLIINEFIYNSYKHAFERNEAGGIIIIIKANRGKLMMKVKDNGKGLPPEFMIKSSDSLGLVLIDSLVSQNGGSIKTSSKYGAEFAITIPLPDQKLKGNGKQK